MNTMDIASCYIADKFFELIDKYNIPHKRESYKEKFFKLDFEYTTEDWKKITEIDETWLPHFYSISNEKSFLEVLSVFGYTDLNTYLVEKKYTDKDGNPSISKWIETIYSKIREEMIANGKIELYGGL